MILSFYKKTLGLKFVLLDEFDLIFSRGTLKIQKYENGEIYMIESSYRTTTNRFFEYKRIKEIDYKIYKNPTKKEFKALLSKSFLNPTLFYYFFNDGKNLQLLDEIINDYKRISIKDKYIKDWFEERREKINHKSV